MSPSPSEDRAVHERRSLRARLAVPLTTLALTLAVGTVGFRVLWREVGGTWLDALFMTFTTITTIGFGEVKPLDSAGRWLTMAVAVTGIGSAFYVFGVVMDYLVSAQMRDARGRRKMQKRIDALEDHFIVAGLGRVGWQAALELAEGKVPLVVIDPLEKAIADSNARGFLTVQGDASEDAVLERAGVRRARGLVVTTGTDATNIYVILSARLLNPTLHIVSRAVDESSVAKLTRAGANRAISPYAIGGRRLAHLMLSPRVVEFFEMTLGTANKALTIGDIPVATGTKAVGQSLGSLRIPQATGATILAILREGNPITTPHGELVLTSGDHLLALGTSAQLEKLEGLLA